jgi:hypothetical protein
MPNKPIAKWPHYALWALEDAQACLIEIDARAREAQELIRAGHALEAVILLGDVRGKAADGRLALAKGRNGER